MRLMRHLIPFPMEEPSQPDAPEWGADLYRAKSQPELPVQDTELYLLAKSQTFTERETESTNYIREFAADTGFGEREVNKHYAEGGMSYQAGSVARRPRKAK